MLYRYNVLLKSWATWYSASMSDVKLLFDVLSSLAAFLAIVTVTISWHKSLRKPLKLARILIHKRSDSATCILVIRNLKDYPVIIERIDGYLREVYEVKKKTGGTPEYSACLFGTNKFLSYTQSVEIPAQGRMDVHIVIQGAELPNRDAVFLLKTSHGFQQVRQKQVDIVEVGKVSVYSLEIDETYDSVLQGKLRYWYELFRYHLRRIFDK